MQQILNYKYCVFFQESRPVMKSETHQSTYVMSHQSLWMMTHSIELIMRNFVMMIQVILGSVIIGRNLRRDIQYSSSIKYCEKSINLNPFLLKTPYKRCFNVWNNTKHKISRSRNVITCSETRGSPPPSQTPIVSVPIIRKGNTNCLTIRWAIEYSGIFMDWYSDYWKLLLDKMPVSIFNYTQWQLY